MYSGQKAFWSETPAQAMGDLDTTAQGLNSDEAKRRLKAYGPNRLQPNKRSDPLTLLISQFKSPIILLLLFAALLSIYLGDKADSIIILIIVFLSGALGFWQEYSAANAIEKLLAMVQVTARVLRDGREVDLPFEDIVPGDVLVLNAGDGIPGDGLILESRDLFVDEAALTGETYPVEKVVGTLPPETPLSKRTNALFMGTHVISGTARAVVVRTGTDTEFGRISEHLRFKPPVPEFERGVTQFGYLLLEITTVMIIAIFAINVYFHRPVLDSFMFALALAVGLTPQLLPAIISINLATGARRMAKEKVIVKQLSSIENFGSMNVLCSDKTGTITEGKVEVYSAVGIDGQKSDKVLLYAGLNACMESGFASPIDAAIKNYCTLDLGGYNKVDEVPYDFIRKRLSVLVAKDGINIIMTKGALQNVMDICSRAELNGNIIGMGEARPLIMKQYNELSAKGFRTLGVSYKDVGQQSRIAKDDEYDMTFLGIIVLYDPPKPGIMDAIKDMSRLGVTLKIITGDNALVAAYINRQICSADEISGGICNDRVIKGTELDHMSDDALMAAVNEVNVFAEVEPNQKERIIIAMKRAGNVVGYMGDGINDGPALHAADVGISVDSAADVAKEAAEIVLMEKDLDVLARGIEEGRKTFANTLKYVFMATSANFGNMFSMAGASLFLPFLPLLPTQILLTNLMTDIPEMTIATDTVDLELVDRPRRWDIGFIKKFMVTFGLVSSIFDFMTFGVLLFLLHASERQFQTGWFMESVVSAAMIVLVIRTRKPFFRSHPGKPLVLATLLIVAVVIVMPYTPIAPFFKFEPLPPVFIVTLAIIVGLYIATVEVIKWIFYRVVKF